MRTFPIRKKATVFDAGADPAAHPDDGASRHRFHANLLVLQHGGHVFCGADQHGGDRGGRRRVPPDEHHPGLGFTFGHGSGNYISRALGHGDVEHARKMATTGFVSAFIAGAVFGVLGLLFLDRWSRSWAPRRPSRLCAGLRPLHPDRHAVHGLLARAEQPAPLPGNAIYGTIGIVERGGA